jgi:hypothetical protein
VSGFGDAVAVWATKAKARSRQVFVGTVHAVHGSIVEGSPVTGAPGQPVVSGRLAESYSDTIEGNLGRVVSGHPAAAMVEDGIHPGGGALLYQHGGGPHSVKLTHAAFPRLVAAVASQVRANG